MTIQANFPALKPALLLDFANTKQLDSRITYTRASTATFYNGVTTAKAEENLVTYSQEFDNAAWAKTAATVTANTTTAPDGTTTADSLVETAANNFHITSRGAGAITSSGLTTFSCFAKANTRTFIVLQINEGANRFATLFNLSTGAVVTTNTTGSPTSTSNSITSVGSGWYRCIVTCNVTSTCDPIVALSDSATPTWSASVPVYTGDGTSGLYIWGAQLEQRSAVSAYTATTTQAITNYIPKLQSAASGVPRFDHNPITFESLGLEIEESRTNLWTRSDDFNDATWIKIRSSVQSNVIIAPDGTLTGDKFISSTDNSNHFIRQDVAVTSGTTYTQTIFAKAGEYSQLYMRFDTDSSQFAGGGAYFTLTGSGVVASDGGVLVSSSITSVGNGWFRCQISATATATVTGVFRIQAATGSTNVFAGNGFSGIFIWGAQLEAGAFATSYIPTVASQVTRAADAASMTGTNFSTWFNAGQGSFIVNAARAAVQDSSGGGGYGRILGNDANNNSFLEYEPVTNVLTVSGVGSYRFTVPSLSTAASVFNNMAVAYDSSGISVTANNAAVQVNSSARMRTSDRLNIFGTGSGSYSSSGWVKKVAYYPIKVTSTNMQALTS